jgi:hypothetical protein
LIKPVVFPVLLAISRLLGFLFHKFRGSRLEVDSVLGRTGGFFPLRGEVALNWVIWPFMSNRGDNGIEPAMRTIFRVGRNKLEGNVAVAELVAEDCVSRGGKSWHCVEEGDYFGAGERVLDLLFCNNEVRFAPGVELC